MSRKQRVLTGLGEIEAGLLKAAKTGSKKNVANLMRNLAVTRDICQEGLSENSYAKYGEIYDGLILAVEQMTKVKELRLNEEAFSLSMDLLQYLIRITEEETSLKKDIVFLPYKASMWDSLESVWKAAAEDEEHCNAYVMPIPYADLNPDGSVAKWHCERDQFPKYVPTLDWSKIDLKEWHPDVIFVHNPYDDCNLVTSVESRYYSRNLKKCTDKLVYIPYFVTGGKDIPDHFCQVPGAFNADYVICESEIVKKIYERNHNVIFPAPVGKFLAFGSPKYDKAVHLRKNNYHIPEAWEQQIEQAKPQFIIFFNSSIVNLLETDVHEYLQEIVHLFVFCKKEKIFIIWRPHPLLEATIQSMREEMYGWYIEIKDNFVKKKLGILDTSADMYAAIAASDGYFGDSSSVAWIYAVTGKPVLLKEKGAYELYSFLGGTQKDGFNNIKGMENAIRILLNEKNKCTLSAPYMKDDNYNCGQRIYDFFIQESLATEESIST